MYACAASSLPDAERVVANLRELGHTVDVDDRLLARAARYFDRLAAAESLPSGQPRPYDAAFTRHQLAGGVLTTLRRQLAELGLEAKFGAVIEEVSRVRAELGYPIMVTPFPQMVMGQALSNVLGRSRYDVVPDQVIRYVLGSFGKPTAPAARHYTPGCSRCCGCCASWARVRRRARLVVDKPGFRL